MTTKLLRRFTDEERISIEKMLADGLTYKEMSRKLNRPISSIQNEIKQGDGPIFYSAKKRIAETTRIPFKNMKKDYPGTLQILKRSYGLSYRMIISLVFKNHKKVKAACFASEKEAVKWGWEMRRQLEKEIIEAAAQGTKSSDLISKKLNQSKSIPVANRDQNFLEKRVETLENQIDQILNILMEIQNGKNN